MRPDLQPQGSIAQQRNSTATKLLPAWYVSIAILHSICNRHMLVLGTIVFPALLLALIFTRNPSNNLNPAGMRTRSFLDTL